MVALRVVAKIRRIVLFGLIWTLVIVTLIQWQQKKFKKKSNRLRFDVVGEESESSSELDFDTSLDVLLSADTDFVKERLAKEKSNSLKRQNEPLEIFEEKSTEKQTCSIIEGVDWKTPVEPKYKLDPNRFLIPVFTYGPNNQLHGFRETVFMAIKLNRTVILPPFFKHVRNDATVESQNEIVPAFLRLDVAKLRETVSLLPPEIVAEACNRRFDAFLTTRSSYCTNTKISRLEAACDYLKMDCKTPAGQFLINDINRADRTKKWCPEPNIAIYPPYDKIPKTTKDGPFSFIEDLDLINKYYNTDKRCAVLGFPYRGISFHMALQGPKHSKGLSDADKSTMKRIISMTPRPKHVTESVKEFYEIRMKRKYVAIHWRYNDDDWANHCKGNHGNPRACQQILEIMHDAGRLGKAFKNFLGKVKTKLGIEVMYIAAPPDEMEMLERVKIEILKDMPTVEIFLSQQLLPFLDARFQSQGCKNYEENRFEILSLAEMELCAKSEIFLRSSGSSWSMNINLERVIAEKDAFDLQNLDLLKDY